MAVEDDLLARLRKIKALMAGAGTAGEREDAGAALEQVKPDWRSRRDGTPRLSCNSPLKGTELSVHGTADLAATAGARCRACPSAPLGHDPAHSVASH